MLLIDPNTNIVATICRGKPVSLRPVSEMRVFPPRIADAYGHGDLLVAHGDLVIILEGV
jgi:hypothetical protein